MFSAAVPQKWVFWLALVDITSLLFLSPKVMLQQDRASARTLQELKAQSLFTVAQGINSCRDKIIQHLQALPCLSFFFFFFLTFCWLYSYTQKVSYIFLLLHRVSVLNHSLLPPPLRKFSFPCAGSSIQRMSVLQKNPASLFFLLHKFPFKWLERPWFL